MINRYNIYNNYKKYKQNKDARNMDQICNSDLDFKLQVQQNFLKDFVNNSNFNKLLLYHQIGSGKTCTSISMAEELLSKDSNLSITIILPARLKTNYIDELISPCGGNKYISELDFIKYNSSDISINEKNKIKRNFMKKIEEKYNIISYEKFKSIALSYKNIDEWLSDFTKNKIIIIDEVHNLISNLYNSEALNTIIKSKIIKKGLKGINSILFKLLAKYADISCKMIFLTATPIFDNINQFYELIKIMNNDVKEFNRNNKLTDLIELLRGKISFFPGTSINAYPNVIYNIKDIEMSKIQENQYLLLLDKEKKSNDSRDLEQESFLLLQRQLGIACDIDITKNLNECSPKIYNLFNDITNKSGKHLIYSSFITKGLMLIKEVLDYNGWINILDVINNEELWKSKYHKIYAIWDSNLKDNEKILIKNIANSKLNIDGKLIRVILGSPSIKEGISFKHIQYLHMLDPVWNQSTKTQIEGRAIRFCSHIDIPFDDPILKREVIINIYKIVPPKDSLIEITADMRIYDDIIPKKYKLIKKAENALKKVSIDYYLFRDLYKKSQKIYNTPKKYATNSPISLSNSDELLINNRNNKTKTSTCLPKERRPVDNKCLKDGYVIKKNKHGDDCCYKK